MWDGRESQAGKTFEENLTQQALDATLGATPRPVCLPLPISCNRLSTRLRCH